MSYVAPPGTAVEVRRPHPLAVQFVIERGVIIHAPMHWIVAYFPGFLDKPADPSDPASIRVLSTNDVIAYSDLVDCAPTWVARTWKHLKQAGPGLLQAPQAVRVWELVARIAENRLHANVTSLLTRVRLESWAGRRLTDEDLGRLDEAIPHSSIPDAIGAIVAGFDSEARPAS